MTERTLSVRAAVSSYTCVHKHRLRTVSFERVQTLTDCEK